MNIPESTRQGLESYARQRVPPSYFIERLLCNDLSGAIGAADFTNRQYIAEIVAWMYWKLPADCWGSQEKVQAWLRLEPTEAEIQAALDFGKTAEQHLKYGTAWPYAGEKP